MSEKLDHKLNNMENNNIFLTKIGPRPIGTTNLKAAINYITREFSNLGYKTIIHDYPTVFWNFMKVELLSNNSQLSVIPNPFSPNCNVKAQHIFITSLETLKNISENKVKDKIIILGGNLTRDILFPLNYIFYNKRINKWVS